jgi:hypothetical protein
LAAGLRAFLAGASTASPSYAYLLVSYQVSFSTRELTSAAGFSFSSALSEVFLAAGLRALFAFVSATSPLYASLLASALASVTSEK